MHRFIIRIVLICGIYWNGASYAHPISPAEQRWIDAHPIVHFSIHEKYAPYLQNQDEAGIFNLLLKKLSNHTQQEFRPKWRKTEQEGLEQLSNGEVDFIIDPPSINDNYLRFGSLSEAIFWGHDAVITKRNKLGTTAIDPTNVAYFDRGYENPPASTHLEPQFFNNSDKLLTALIKNDVEALILPIRLAQQLIQKVNDPQIQLDGIYNRELCARFHST